MCTAIIVVSLPGFKRLVSQDATPPNSQYNRNTHGYVQTGSGKPKETPKNTTTGSSSSYINGGKWNDEMELVYLDREQMGQKAKDVSNVVTVTRDVTVSKDVM